MDTGLTVTIAGTDYSSSALNEVRIRVGRDNVDAVIEPHAAAVQLLHRDVPSVDPNAFEIGQTLTITVDKQATAGTHTLFTGQITDLVVNRDALELVAVSAPIVDLARQQITTAGTTGTVLEAFDTTYGLISSPSYEPAGGFYALGAGDTITVPAGTYTASDVLQTIAQSAIEGLLNQNQGDAVFFTTSEDRRTFTPDLELEGDEVLIDWEVTRRRSQLVNRVDIDWTSGTETASDPTSIAGFGILTKEIETFLDVQADAQAYADFELARATVPAFYLDRVTVPAHTLTAANYDVLVVAPIRQPTIAPAWQDVPVGTAWDDLAVSQIWQDFQIADSTAGAFLLRIPELFAGLPQSYFVEGATYTITRNTCDVELSISESSLTRPVQRWVDVSPTILWQNVEVTQTWDDLNKEEVTV
jgi:hypothetical protein